VLKNQQCGGKSTAGRRFQFADNMPKSRLRCPNIPANNMLERALFKRYFFESEFFTRYRLHFTRLHKWRILHSHADLIISSSVAPHAVMGPCNQSSQTGARLIARRYCKRAQRHEAKCISSCAAETAAQSADTTYTSSYTPATASRCRGVTILQDSNIIARAGTGSSPVSEESSHRTVRAGHRPNEQSGETAATIRGQETEVELDTGPQQWSNSSSRSRHILEWPHERA